MHLRFTRVAHVLALGLIAVLTPACTSNNKKAAPNISNSSPASGDTVPLCPFIVFEFDRPMDPAFVNAAYFGFADANTNATIPFDVEYEPAINEVRIIPTAPLNKGSVYNVWAQGTIQSAEGTQMGSAEGITVTATTTSQLALPITNFGFTAVTGTNPGDINLDWTANPGTETFLIGGVSTVQSPIANYDIYVSTTQNGVEYLDTLGNPAPFMTAHTTSTTINLPLHGTVYYIKIVPRDTEGNVYEAKQSDTSATTMHD